MKILCTDVHLINKQMETTQDEYIKQNGLICLNTKFQKKKRKANTNNPNGTKTQLDFMLINSKWFNNVINCGAYNSCHSFTSDHKTLTKIQLSL